jgi:hypothetical protein
VNHIATGRALSPGGELLPSHHRMAETVTETDGDGSGGTSLSRQGAKTETSIPRNLSLTAAAL